MPELSRFYGIIIRMFSEPSGRHHAPHFHAYYGGHVAVFSISPVALVHRFHAATPAAPCRSLGGDSLGGTAFRLATFGAGSEARTNHPFAIRISAMHHPIYRIISFERVGLHSLHLKFDDGVSRTIDFESILEGELYGPLRDADAFSQVTLDPEIHTVVWPCGADFDPATLHDWPEHEAAFRAAAARWSHSNASA